MDKFNVLVVDDENEIRCYRYILKGGGDKCNKG